MMDKERQRKLQNLRLIITESIMVVVIVVMVIVLTFVAMGYKLSQDGGLSQNGLLQVTSIPTGASVEVDGEMLFSRTPTSRSLTDGRHSVKLTRAGYDTWEKQIDVSSGWLYKLDYPRLFKRERETTTIKQFESKLAFFSISPDRNNILYAEDGSNDWHLLKIRDDASDETTIRLGAWLDAAEGEARGNVQKLIWSDTGDRVILEWKKGETTEFFVINLTRPENTINLTKEFGMNFTKVAPASESAERLLVLENQNLRMISLGNKEVSRILLSNVSDFANLESEVLFVMAPEENTVQTVGYYREGGADYTALQAVEGDGVKLAVSRYLDRLYLTFVIGTEMTVYRGDTIHDKMTLDDLEIAKQVQLITAPEEVVVHNRGRFVVGVNGAKVVSYNAELNEISQFELETDFAGWLDGFMMFNIQKDEMIVRDFDGQNRRAVVGARPGYTAVIDNGNRYLYYVGACEHQSGDCLKRDTL